MQRCVLVEVFSMITSHPYYRNQGPREYLWRLQTIPVFEISAKTILDDVVQIPDGTWNLEPKIRNPEPIALSGAEHAPSR